MSELSELKEFRERLVKARDSISKSCRVYSPMESYGFAITMPDGMTYPITNTGANAPGFAEWCDSHSDDDIRQMYTNSIAALDARIAKLQEGK